jgi:hypothetical protein
MPPSVTALPWRTYQRLRLRSSPPSFSNRRSASPPTATSCAASPAWAASSPASPTANPAGRRSGRAGSSSRSSSRDTNSLRRSPHPSEMWVRVSPGAPGGWAPLRKGGGKATGRHAVAGASLGTAWDHQLRSALSLFQAVGPVDGRRHHEARWLSRREWSADCHRGRRGNRAGTRCRMGRCSAW